MSKPHKSFLSRVRSNSRRRQMRRKLAAESLERRWLLTTIQSVAPAANSEAPANTDISATFDQDVVAASANDQTFVVHGHLSGRLTGGATNVTAAGPVVTHNPTGNFAPGEVVSVTATAGINTTGGAANARVWQFHTEANSGSGQFTDSGQTFPFNDGQSVAFGDVDGDGDADVLSGNRLLWINDGSGVFSDSGQAIQTGGEARFVDVDGDGDVDILGSTTVLINDGSGIFTDSTQNLGGGPTVGIGDLDADGDVDVMVGASYGPNRVFLNNGNGQFLNTGQSLGTATTTGLALADFDGDGDLDAFAANNGPANRIWLNDGSGVFTDSGQALGGFSATFDVEVGDVDGDGDLDAVAGNEYGNVGARIWINDGSALFVDSGQRVASTGNSRIASLKLGDLDGDGDLDIFAANRRDPSQVWLNDGAGVFADSGQRLTFTFNERRIDDVDLADIDGDGDLDVWEQNIFNGSHGAKIWINQNLQPSVSLSVDNATIDEAAGTAIVTATLSAAHTAEVTVDLAFSGDATATDDYTTSGNQIIIPVGQTSGSVTITAVDDTADEPDESVVVDISGVANADEAGTQQVTTTILDNDEPAPVPDVSLAVDNAAILEASGVATFTATLSLVTTVDVTVDLEISGTATAGEDYNTSGSQITIAAGQTSGAITVTAVQDELDEADESVIVDIANVTGGNEAGGNQQATTTITDDDEPVVPDVSLAVDNSAIDEAGGVATFTATLSETTTVPVTIDLEISGSATAGDDYNASNSEIVIAAGATSGSITVTAVQDELDEPDETVVVDISAVENGNEAGGNQQAITSITDDDEPQGFAVTSVTPTSTGVQVAFTNPIDTGDLNLYDSQTAGLGAADLILTGAASGPVIGSLVASETMVEFIKSGDPLAPDTYTLTLRSATDGFEDTGGLLLDGNGDGTAGDDFSSTFTVSEPAANTVTVSIPDFVRGPGQAVNLPADDTTGIPLTISDGTNVRAIDARISYDPELLQITGGSLGPDAPAGASVIVNTSTPGLAIVVYFAIAPLPAGEAHFVNLQASVPEANASENYRRQQIIDLHGLIVSDGNDNESPAIDNDGLHMATFFADVSANGRVNAADASGVARIAALIDGGFANTPNTDPGILGDISGNGRLNAADASLVAQFAALISVPQIPEIPGGVVISGLPNVGTDTDPVERPAPTAPHALAFADLVDPAYTALADPQLEDLAEELEREDEESSYAELLDEAIRL